MGAGNSPASEVRHLANASPARTSAARLPAWRNKTSTRTLPVVLDADPPVAPFAKSRRSAILLLLYFWGRTGFDLKFEAQAACRGWFVGLVKNRAKKNKRRSPRSRSRGLIDRDVWSWTPATAPNVDSRLIVRRSDRVGR